MTAMAKENPITKVLRASSMRAVIICRPLMKMKADEKNRLAPTTGSGTDVKALAAAGLSASNSSITPIADPLRGADVAHEMQRPGNGRDCERRDEDRIELPERMVQLRYAQDQERAGRQLRRNVGQS